MKKDLIALVYVDDVLFFGTTEKIIDEMIKDLQKDFDLNVEDDVFAFLGIEIFKNKQGQLCLRQKGLIDRIISAVGMDENTNAAKTPAATIGVGADVGGKVREKNWNYASVVGMLLYLAGNTRPDIAFAVHQAARFSHKPMKVHEDAVKRIVRYLIGTKEEGLSFGSDSKLNLEAYADADFAGLWGVEEPSDATCVKSRTGYLIRLGGCPLVWKSKLQTLIAVSTMEAEYIALSMCMRELIPLKRILAELNGVFKFELEGALTKSTVFEDNASAVQLATVPKMTPRSKHIALHYHFFRKFIGDGIVEVKHVSTDLQIADIFTKGLGDTKFEKLRKLLMGW
mmetsp:Transcript_31063/g.45455  ORF Transcript_31063/g.45455 Transcript_31063/m.45455 type:complete len:340 (+) Transcript_31063:1620-2639(+)